MPASDIVIKGAREHNLRDVSLSLPRNKLICLTGVSGSGKSSLAFDTLYAEGQRRYVESLSTFARQFLGQMPKPDVDFIGGLSPSISISQKTSGQNPRSTVGTITEIYDYLRVLYARIGRGHCPHCHQPITAQTRDHIIDRILVLPKGTKYSVLAPLIRGQKGEHKDLFIDLLKQGFVRARVDGEIHPLSDDLSLDRQMRHNIEVVVDRLAAGESRGRVAEAVELALKVGSGSLIVAMEGDKPSDPEAEEPSPKSKRSAKRTAIVSDNDIPFSAHYACTTCGISFEPPSPQLFSFNSPQGMCRKCDGLGELYTFDPKLLVPDDRKSFKDGCLEILGKWADLGRWRRHIYQGVADTIEYKRELPSGAMVQTAWRDLDPELKDLWLWGTGDEHITFTWRGGVSGSKYGGKFGGIIPELQSKYRGTQSKMHLRQLEKYMSVLHCGECKGSRLNPQSRSVTIRSQHTGFAKEPAFSLPQVCHLAISQAQEFFSELDLTVTEGKIAEELLKEIRGRLGFLTNVGLEYLTLDRTAPTLSGGESQRIRLAGQVGCGLVGVLYILDEPSIGLHPRDNQRLLDTLTTLRDLGNTVVVVEHDEDTMRAADHIIDFGPGPGVRGGEVVASGSVDKIMKSAASITGKFLSGKETIAIPKSPRPLTGKKLTIQGATHNNLKDIDADIPLGAFVCVTGASGSGKSSLVGDILVEALSRDLNGGDGHPGKHKAIIGIEHLDKLIAIDQSPIGRTPRSNPSTYIKLFDEIRDLYAQIPESKARGYKVGRFSFNVPGGRCEACEGNGSTRLEMDFLADVWVTCPVCQGERFGRETLHVRFKGKSISEVLEMDVQQALEHFENVPKIRHRLQTLHDVGLDYIKLGQPSPTLSGGEAQRIKLARELVKRSTGQTLYLLDEPTTGLHFADVRLLLKVLHDFVEAGNTVLVVEHNLDVIKTADWIIDLGPDGGSGGGEIIAAGPPREVAQVKRSYTGQALKALFDSLDGKSPPLPPRAPTKVAPPIRAVRVQGARQHNLKGIDVEIPRDQMTVCCGMSGSGKSSLAMDTIYAEGQRRYVESLSSYARQFVGQMQKPALDHIEGLSPAIAIEQKNLGHSPRSTVGTVTEIYDYFRILLARLGQPHCPDCELPIGTQTADEIVDKILSEAPGTKLYLMAPIGIAVGDRYEELWEEMKAAGYARARIDGTTFPLESPPQIDRRRRHDVEIVIDRIVVKPDAKRRIADSIESALNLGKGVLHVAYADDDLPEPKWQTKIHSQHFACEKCGRSFEPLSPHHFSFNSALGWCPQCEGLGTQIGTNPAALLHDPKLPLAEGAIALWPKKESALFQQMLPGLTKLGLPVDAAYDQLSVRQRRLVLYGPAEENWSDASAPGAKAVSFRFQYKGLYPALEEAAKLSPALRATWEHLVDEVDCSTCGGSRLRDDAAAVRLRSRTMDGYCRLTLENLAAEILGWKLDTRERKIAGELVREISSRLEFLNEVGLGYLTLGRQAPTLSGGEAQRIRLASQVGSGLVGVLYILDEPTIGLHPRDNRRLLSALEKLRDLGNTLLLVEHDQEVIEAADQLLDFGPAAGEGGGQIVARGTPKEVAKNKNSVTGPFLTGERSIPIPINRRILPAQGDGSAVAESAKPAKKPAATKGRAKTENGDLGPPSLPADQFHWISILGARHNNLRNINVRLPLGALTVVTGVSGSGKSSLVEDVLYNVLAKKLHRASTPAARYDEIKGVDWINKVIRVDQQPLGNTPSSNPATYTGVFELIRSLYSQIPEARLRGYQPRRFSANVPGGRCEACEGMGQRCIEMHFLPDVWVECEVCEGKRYNPETLSILYHGQSIADVLNMSCGRALALFENIPKIRRVLQTLCDVGLDYVRLGQSAPTLSGGEAQRVKLAAELARPDTGRTLYLLDEPTTGLHFEDIRKLLDVLNRLVDLGNTVVVIEHNVDVIKTADWVVDMGPEAGDGGGYVVVGGTPEEIVAYAKRAEKDKKLHISYTGGVLAKVLENGTRELRTLYQPLAQERERPGDLDITEVGKEIAMPWMTNGRRWHTQDRVSRNGTPARWDGRILETIVDRIQELGDFEDTKWDQRGVVEIASTRKAEGWFFHALTGEEWLLGLKFRVSRGTFKRDELIGRLALKPFNDLPDLPVYGHEPRIACKSTRGPWQEIQLRVHAYEEIDTPGFRSFLEEAVQGFGAFSEKARQRPEELAPWKVQGQKWHFARKGFPPGKSPQWEADVLEELCELIAEAAPHGQFLWNNQQVVHYFVPQQREPWASIFTKRLNAVELALHGPHGKFALGRVRELGSEREFVAAAALDTVRLRFVTGDDLHRGDLPEFLTEHVTSLGEGKIRTAKA
jgi:excinuclease ABC subunit A